MSKNPYYSDKQLEIDSILRSALKDDAPNDVIDSIMTIVGDAENKKESAEEIDKSETIDSIKLRLLDETDWRKKAALSAMIISKSLDI
jgi:hypothetical protein